MINYDCKGYYLSTTEFLSNFYFARFSIILKIIATSFILVFSFNVARAQKSFSVTIKLDSSIIPQKIHYQYYNGKNLVFLPDTFGEKRVIILKDQYYSPFASLNISYTDSTNTPYDNDFFINDKPASIKLYFKANNENKLKYNAIENAAPIYDTITNKTWRELQAFMSDKTVAKENEAFDSFLKQNKGFAKNDSLKKVFDGFYKARLDRSMLFLKRYPADYFSLWYFIQQVAQANSVLRNDTAYLKKQLAYLKAVFPAKYLNSIEGKELIETYMAAIRKPLQLNDPVPQFALITIDGNKINLKGFKGKYLLLDFWATWCPPCLAEIPFIKEIRKKYTSDKLEILGISADRDSKKLYSFVKKQRMNWLHFYDGNREIGQLYGVDAIPRLILVNKEGKMIYDSYLKENDKDSLIKLLESLN